MVAARKTYEDFPIFEEEEKKNIKRQRPRPEPNNRLVKFVFTMIIVISLCLCIVLLKRFVSITETRHRVHNLETELEKIENRKEQLKIEVEKVSKSKWIEEEAKARLNMQYPLPEQVLYIHIQPNEVAMISNQLRENSADDLSSLPNTRHGFYTTINKIFGLF